MQSSVSKHYNSFISAFQSCSSSIGFYKYLSFTKKSMCFSSGYVSCKTSWFDINDRRVKGYVQTYLFGSFVNGFIIEKAEW